MDVCVTVFHRYIFSNTYFFIMETNKRAIYILNDLLEKNYDAESSYSNAAHDVEDPRLKNFLLQNSELRQAFAIDLAEEIMDAGGRPVSEGSLPDQLHQGWFDLRAIVTSRDEKTIIAECIRGEQATLKDYNKALSSNKLDDSTEAMLEEHRDEIVESISLLESLTSTGEVY